VTLSDGSLYGTFCAAGLTTDKDLTKRDKALMDVLTSAAAVIIEPEVRAQERRTEISDRLDPLIAAGGPVVALQPIVDLATGDRVGAEGSAASPRSGAWRLTPECADLLSRLPLPRVLLGLSAHEQAEDYGTLNAALRTLGVDYGRGWHYGRPGPPEALSEAQSAHPGAAAEPDRTAALLKVPGLAHETGASGHDPIAAGLPAGNSRSWPIRIQQRTRTRATSVTTDGPTRWVPTWPPQASSSS
jgi:hypothetical protein